MYNYYLRYERNRSSMGPPQRGKQLVRLAQVRSGARGEVRPLDEHGEINWEATARKQGTVSRSLLEGGRDGLVVALEDQRSCDKERWRRVLVRVHRKSAEVHIFDQWGKPIDEVGDHVCKGRQSWPSFIAAFDAKQGVMTGKTYRSPILRRMPRARNVMASSPRSSSTPSGTAPFSPSTHHGDASSTTCSTPTALAHASNVSRLLMLHDRDEEIDWSQLIEVQLTFVGRARPRHSRAYSHVAPCVMLDVTQAKAADLLERQKMRQRVESEMGGIMDTGIRVNPLLQVAPLEVCM